MPLSFRGDGRRLVAVAAPVLLVRCSPAAPAPAPGPVAALVAVEDSDIIARGRYLVNGPAHCVACHTPEGPLTAIDPSHPPAMTGGYVFRVPGGEVRAPNLTSDLETGIGARTDAELVAALRYGRRSTGGPLLPFMELQGLSDEDLVAVLSYLRTLAPVRSDVRVRNINLFARFLMAQVVTEKGPTVSPPRRSPTGPSVERGEYLTKNVAMCAACHTRRSRTGGYKGQLLSGGYRMADEVHPSRELVTPNLTPDSETGRMVRWSEDQFVTRFQAGRLIPGSPMPWSSFATMTDTDLRSIYRYLMSVPPVRHAVGPVSDQSTMSKKE